MGPIPGIAVTNTGDITIETTVGAISNVTSTEGSVRIVMSDRAPSSTALSQVPSERTSNSATSPASSTPSSTRTFTTKSNSSQTPTEKDVASQTSSTNNIIGTIIRCTQCGIKSLSINSKNRVGPMSNTPEGTTIQDSAGKSHLIATDGVFQIINDGSGSFRIERVSDHNHL